jgi:caffeoyl-CoA O-methyltransferase
MELISLQVQEYLHNFIPPRNKTMEEMEKYAGEIKFPIIGPVAGYFCYLIARMIKAKRICELGSGFGYSTAWFARAVKENGGGKVYHIVWDEELSQKARNYLNEMGYGKMIHYIVSEAVSALKTINGPFDLIFNDIDKEGYPDSLVTIKENLSPGGVLITDNILWHGRIFDPDDLNPATKGIKEFTDKICDDPDFITSIVPIRDGLIVAMKKI